MERCPSILSIYFSFSHFVFIYLSTHSYMQLSIYSSNHVSICHLSVHLSTYPSFHPYICPSVYLSTYPVFHLYIYASYPYIPLFIHVPFIHLFIYPSLHIFICVFIIIYSSVQLSICLSITIFSSVHLLFI